MYNGIGLTTARGSGTNGYVQRNVAFVRQFKERVQYRSEDELARLEQSEHKQPNAEVLQHQRKRQVELKCIEMESLMEEQGYSTEEIEVKVSAFRKMLLDKEGVTENNNVPEVEKDEQGRPIVKDSHQLAAATKEKNAQLKAAFGISEYFIEGSSFDKDRKTKEKAAAELAARRYALLKEPSDNEDNLQLEEDKKRKKVKKRKHDADVSGGSGSDRKSKSKKKKEKKKKKHKKRKKKPLSDSEEETDSDDEDDDSDASPDHHSKQKRKGSKKRKKEKSKKKAVSDDSDEDSSSEDEDVAEKHHELQKPDTRVSPPAAPVASRRKQASPLPQRPVTTAVPASPPPPQKHADTKQDKKRVEKVGGDRLSKKAMLRVSKSPSPVDVRIKKLNTKIQQHKLQQQQQEEEKKKQQHQQHSSHHNGSAKSSSLTADSA